MGKYDNMKVFKRGLNVFVEQKVKPHLTVILAEVAQDVVDYIDQISSEKNAGGLPILTGALHDASGVGVYRDGILAAYRPRQIYNTQEASGQMFSPEDMFDYALSWGAQKFPTGIWLVVFSAMPYAAQIDEEGSPIGRGRGFFYDMIVPFAIKALRRRI